MTLHSKICLSKYERYYLDSYHKGMVNGKMRKDKKKKQHSKGRM